MESTHIYIKFNQMRMSVSKGRYMENKLFDFGGYKIPYYKREVGENSGLLHCALSIKRGSMQDYIGGTAHCLEHMMIENEYVSSIDWNIVDRWAHTDFYDTTYYFLVSTENFKYVYEIIQGMLSGRWLTKSIYTNILPHIIEEYLKEIDTVDSVKKRALFSKSIYEKKLPIGVCNSVYKIQYRDIEKYYTENYLKSMPLFIVSGDTKNFEKKYYEKIESDKYNILKETIDYIPLSFDNDLIINNFEIMHIYINIDIEQKPIFFQYEARFIRACITSNCLNSILKEELGTEFQFIECRLVRLSTGFYFIDMKFRKIQNNICCIIDLIKNIKWCKYLELIREEIHFFLKEYCKIRGTNLGNIVNEILNSVIFNADYLKDKSLFQVKTEEIVAFLEELTLRHKFRIIL